MLKFNVKDRKLDEVYEDIIREIISDWLKMVVEEFEVPTTNIKIGYEHSKKARHNYTDDADIDEGVIMITVDFGFDSKK